MKTKTTTTANNIVNPLGFYETYFDLLKFFPTNKDAFNFLNNAVERMTGKKPYKSFKTWGKQWGKQTM